MLVGRLVNKLPVQHLRKSDASLIDSDTLLGVEVEVEHCKGFGTGNKADPEALYWTSKEDHSLRNNGMEFVFSEPLYGADAVAAIRWLCKLAESKKWIISERTGIHVHVDVRNMELDKFRNMCILYCLVEPLLYNWIGDKRDRNIHCLPWYAADSDLDMLSTLLNLDTPTPSAVYTIKSLNRYAGLNLNSLHMFGTAEFRQLKTTFDANRIIKWINMLLCIKQAALAWQGTHWQLLKEMRLLGAFTFCRKIFADTMTDLWYPGFVKDFLGVSMPTAQVLVENTKKYTPEDARRMMAQHIRNTSDEAGTHPGLEKFLKKKEAADKSPIKNPKKLTTEEILSTIVAGKAPGWSSQLNTSPIPKSPKSLKVNAGYTHKSPFAVKVFAGQTPPIPSSFEATEFFIDNSPTTSEEDF